MAALIAVAVFAAAAALDYATARYQRACKREDAHAAARWSVTMCLLSSLGIYAFVSEPAMVFVECAGLYAGTLMAFRGSVKE